LTYSVTNKTQRVLYTQFFIGDKVYKVPEFLFSGEQTSSINLMPGMSYEIPLKLIPLKLGMIGLPCLSIFDQS